MVASISLSISTDEQSVGGGGGRSTPLPSPSVPTAAQLRRVNSTSSSSSGKKAAAPAAATSSLPPLARAAAMRKVNNNNGSKSPPRRPPTAPPKGGGARSGGGGGSQQKQRRPNNNGSSVVSRAAVSAPGSNPMSYSTIAPSSSSSSTQLTLSAAGLTFDPASALLGTSLFGPCGSEEFLQLPSSSAFDEGLDDGQDAAASGSEGGNHGGADLSAAPECDYDANPTDLYLAIQDQNWGLAAKRASTHPTEASTWVSRCEADGETLRWRLLPIHAAIVFSAPPKVVSALLSAYPHGAQCRDDQGKLALHLCFRRKSDLQVVSLLLQAHPGSASELDDKGRTPLALAKKCSDKVVGEEYARLLASFGAHEGGGELGREAVARPAAQKQQTDGSELAGSKSSHKKVSLRPALSDKQYRQPQQQQQPRMDRELLEKLNRRRESLEQATVHHHECRDDDDNGDVISEQGTQVEFDVDEMMKQEEANASEDSSPAITASAPATEEYVWGGASGSAGNDNVYPRRSNTMDSASRGDAPFISQNNGHSRGADRDVAKSDALLGPRKDRGVPETHGQKGMKEATSSRESGGGSSGNKSIVDMAPPSLRDQMRDRLERRNKEAGLLRGSQAPLSRTGELAVGSNEESSKAVERGSEGKLRAFLHERAYPDRKQPAAAKRNGDDVSVSSSICSSTTGVITSTSSKSLGRHHSTKKSEAWECTLETIHTTEEVEQGEGSTLPTQGHSPASLQSKRSNVSSSSSVLDITPKKNNVGYQLRASDKEEAMEQHKSSVGTHDCSRVVRTAAATAPGARYLSSSSSRDDALAQCESNHSAGSIRAARTATASAPRVHSESKSSDAVATSESFHSANSSRSNSRSNKTAPSARYQLPSSNESHRVTKCESFHSAGSRSNKTATVTRVPSSTEDNDCVDEILRKTYRPESAGGIDDLLSRINKLTSKHEVGTGRGNEDALVAPKKGAGRLSSKLDSNIKPPNGSEGLDLYTSTSLVTAPTADMTEVQSSSYDDGSLNEVYTSRYSREKVSAAETTKESNRDREKLNRVAREEVRAIAQVPNQSKPAPVARDEVPAISEAPGVTKDDKFDPIGDDLSTPRLMMRLDNFRRNASFFVSPPANEGPTSDELATPHLMQQAERFFSSTPREQAERSFSSTPRAEQQPRTLCPISKVDEEIDRSNSASSTTQSKSDRVVSSCASSAPKSKFDQIMAKYSKESEEASQSEQRSRNGSHNSRSDSLRERIASGNDHSAASHSRNIYRQESENFPSVPGEYPSYLSTKFQGLSGPESTIKSISFRAVRPRERYQNIPDGFNPSPVSGLKLQPSMSEDSQDFAMCIPKSRSMESDAVSTLSRTTAGCTTLGSVSLGTENSAVIESYVQSVVHTILQDEVENAGTMKEELEAALRSKMKLKARVKKLLKKSDDDSLQLKKAHEANRIAKDKYSREMEIHLTRKASELKSCIEAAFDQAEQSKRRALELAQRDMEREVSLLRSQLKTVQAQGVPIAKSLHSALELVESNQRALRQAAERDARSALEMKEEIEQSFITAVSEFEHWSDAQLRMMEARWQSLEAAERRSRV